MTLGVSGSTPNDSRSTPHDIGSTPHDNGWEHFQGLGVLPVSLGKHRRWKPESPKARTKMAPKCNQKEAPDIIMTFRSSFCYRARNGVIMAPGRFIVRPCRAMLGVEAEMKDCFSLGKNACHACSTASAKIPKHGHENPNVGTGIHLMCRRLRQHV